MAKDLRNPDYAESVKAAQKVIGKQSKKKSIIPVELRLFLKGVPLPEIVVVGFLIAESLVGIGFTLYYLWEWVLLAVLLTIGTVIFLKVRKKIKKCNFKKRYYEWRRK